jgi:hypothetical protein
MKNIALVFVFSLIFLSCEKDKQIIKENTDIPLLIKVMDNGLLSHEYTYNEANLLSEEKSKFFYTKHNYNDKNLLTTSDFFVDQGIYSSLGTVAEASWKRKEWVSPANTEKSLTQSFDYNGQGLLIRKTYNRLPVNYSEYSEFTFDNDRISRQTMFWKNELSFYIDYLYDEQGNLIKESKYYVPSIGLDELWTTTEYEYDNMHNPFQAFTRLMSPGKFTNPNNITKETYTVFFEVDQWTQKVSVINNSYEYNDKGYPVKVNGVAEYIYK